MIAPGRRFPYPDIGVCDATPVIVEEQSTGLKITWSSWKAITKKTKLLCCSLELELAAYSKAEPRRWPR